MSSTAYIAHHDDTERVYLDLEPTPTPVVMYASALNHRRTLNSRNSSGVIEPGQWHHYAGGTHISGGIIRLGILKMSSFQYEQIIEKVKYSKGGTVIFSPNDGITRYRCVIDMSSGGPDVIQGTELMSWNMKLYVIEAI